MEQPVNTQTKHCPVCRQRIAVEARKCFHCGESLVERSWFSKWIRKLMALVGIVTALLSLFFGLKEGYFFIQERQEKRAIASAHIEAAKRFIELDSLSYAEQSLEKALSANPNNLQLRTRIYFMRSDHFLREADYFGSQFPEERLAAVSDLVLKGFSLLNASLSSVDRVHLLTSLGRLIQHDRRWQSAKGVNELFEQARRLGPSDSEALFWSGDWLRRSDQEDEQAQGRRLIQQAAELDPDNPVYSHALGLVWLNEKLYRNAFDQFLQAIASKPDQRQLHRIRAANEAKRSLARSILVAHEEQSILEDKFFDMSMDQRLELVSKAVEHSNNRRLAWVASQLFHHTGQHARAEEQLRKVLGRYDNRSPVEQLMLFSKVLAEQGESDEQTRVDNLLVQAAERAQYEQVLELGETGKHQYKIGLKVNKRFQGEGVHVETAYELYPFHKAGVRNGDQLIEFGHRKISNLRDILYVVYSFSPGADVPLVVIRKGEQLKLAVVIE